VTAEESQRDVVEMVRRARRELREMEKAERLARLAKGLGKPRTRRETEIWSEGVRRRHGIKRPEDGKDGA
jgi:hypothetical protein